MIKNPPANAGDKGSIPGSGGSVEKGMATHSSILAWNPMDRGGWWATVHGVAKESDVTYQLNNNSNIIFVMLFNASRKSA